MVNPNRSWLDNEFAFIETMRAQDVGFQPSRLNSRWLETFGLTLMTNPDAKRLVSDFLPRLAKRSVLLLAGFVVMLASGRELENALLGLTKQRGQRFKKLMRARGRTLPERRKDAAEFLRRAERAFDVRRKGLAEYCPQLVIIRGYLRCRCGLEPTARELAALLKAGLAALGRERFIDYDLLRRNIKNFEKRRSAPIDEVCAKVIEDVSQAYLT